MPENTVREAALKWFWCYLTGYDKIKMRNKYYPGDPEKYYWRLTGEEIENIYKSENKPA